MEYVYEPLGPDMEIRLLALQPGSDKASELHCTMFHAKPPRMPCYTALSYVWGAPDQAGFILLNGTRTKVTQNLEHALRHIRQADTEVVLWVDAVCIDQSNEPEKSHQVRQMTKIYSQAKKTILWAGRNERDNHLATEFVGFFDINIPDNEQLLRGIPDQVFSVITSAFSEEYSKHWDEVMAIASCPCWTRVWIVQEVLLSQNCSILWGNSSIPWGLFAKIFRLLSISTSRMLHIMNTNHHFGAMKLHEKMLPKVLPPESCRVKDWATLWTTHEREQKPLDLVQCLLRTRCHCATDPRDRVYGLLGISEPHAIEPDYSKSVGLVYQDAAKYLIESTRSLDLLSACKPSKSSDSSLTPSRDIGQLVGGPPHQHSDNIPDRIPSWVPDWNQAIDYEDYLLFSDSSGCYFQASANREMVAQFPTDDILRCSGVLVEEIVYVRQETLHPRITPGQEIWSTKDLWILYALVPPLQNLWNVYRQCNSRDEGEDSNFHENVETRQAFVQTLSAGSSFLRQDSLRRTAQQNRAALVTLIFKLIGASRESPTVGDLQNLEDFPSIMSRLTRNIHNNAFFITRSGQMGIGPQTVQKGDQVVILFGARVPFVLRPIDSEFYVLMGECYIHEVMHGEIVQEYEEGKRELQIFNLK